MNEGIKKRRSRLGNGQPPLVTIPFGLLLMGILMFGVSVFQDYPTAAQLLSPGETQFTPVVLSVLEAPKPVTGSDGLVHVVYELHATNAMGFPIRLESIEVLDLSNPGTILHEITTTQIPQKMQGLISKSSIDTLEAGHSGIIFIHFTLSQPEPKNITLGHRLTVSGDFPKGLYNFLGLPETQKHLVEMGGITQFSHTPIPTIGPPLAGKNWIAADGCCTAKRHIRAILPINGKLRVAQRFAIDWERLNEDHRIFVGDASNVNSYFAYGQEVLAVADATVVAVVDRYQDQLPGKLPSNMPLTEAEGNHVVLDLGNDQFALYAHLQPGSLTAQALKVGDKVCRGQVLGLVGNSGHSSAPHLHFHIMSSPSTLGSNGLPYNLEQFELLGRARSTQDFDKAEQDGSALTSQPVHKSGTHSKELPLDLSIVTFPPQQVCEFKG